MPWSVNIIGYIVCDGCDDVTSFVTVGETLPDELSGTVVAVTLSGCHHCQDHRYRSDGLLVASSTPSCHLGALVVGLFRRLKRK